MDIDFTVIRDVSAIVIAPLVASWAIRRYMRRHDKPKRPSIAESVLLVSCFASIYAGVSIAERTVGAQWSDNMNCLLGIIIAVVIIGVFALIRRALLGSSPDRRSNSM